MWWTFSVILFTLAMNMLVTAADSHNNISPGQSRYPPGPGEAHHLCKDEFQAS